MQNGQPAIFLVALAALALLSSAAAVVVDGKPYLPIDALDGTVRVYETSGPDRIPVVSYQKYAVTEEKGRSFLVFQDYDASFALRAETRQEVTERGLEWIGYTTWSKGKTGAVERFVGSASGLILPWKLDPAKTFEKKYSWTYWFDASFGSVTCDASQILAFKGIETVEIRGKRVECAVVEAAQIIKQKSDSGWKGEFKADYTFYYARDFGFIMSRDELSRETVTCTGSMSVAAFEALKTKK